MAHDRACFLAAVVTLTGCAAAGVVDESAAVATAKRASSNFCAEAAGCEYRVKREGATLVVTADRYRLAQDGRRYHRLDDSFIYVIGSDGQIIKSYSASP